MPFTAKSGKFNASIKTVTVGTGDKAITLGGENVLPFYTFDAPIENAPKVGIEITDFGMENEPECVKKYYEGCTTLADIAKKLLLLRVLTSYASVWRAAIPTEQTNQQRN